ncbi:MAG: siphovirus Gp157 family protein [Hyphomicrobiaceae bacterium]|nr:siphovirus Gp157 family protein [Hyphomicrobiaceae bacterium]
MRTKSQAMVTLPSELARHAYLRSRLLAEIPNLDADTLADTLEGMTDLHEMVAEVIRSALDDEALASGLSTRLADMKARLERLTQRAKRKRALALNAMEEAQISKITEADFTASLRHGSVTLEVTAEEQIPPDYWRPQPARLDRQELLVALKAGAVINGAYLASPQAQLSVRAK